ncbi:enoyl-CoA hydratase/isomerase family protein [Bradyrhizobium ivorense]|uniref:enoyl-CoA hydratase/isomerase family protein n=1 Tax=Bradyrhizobium ivorense TaxID=2511166 RepID=UPI00111747D8
MCDIRYCSDDSRFGITATRFAAGALTLAMPWVIRQRCRELLYTGDMFDAQEAYRLGLVSRVFPKGQLEEEVIRIAKRMSRVACRHWCGTRKPSTTCYSQQDSILLCDTVPKPV